MFSLETESVNRTITENQRVTGRCPVVMLSRHRSVETVEVSGGYGKFTDFLKWTFSQEERP